MSELDVIIPVQNEVDNVEELAERVDKSLRGAGIDYSLIFVDDYSTDGTREKLEELARGNGEVSNGLVPSGRIIYDAAANDKPRNHSKIKLLPKKGKKGKAYSVLEGARQATAPYVAMIDGDLQYPPEAIPSMYKLAQKHGMVVANRKNYKNSWIRGEGSKINKFLFERLLLGFKCDAQSGLKVFKKEIVDNLNEQEVGPWTLDMPLLAKALELGYKIGTLDIDFKERKSGQSKVNFVKTAIEIAGSAIRLKFKRKRTYLIGSKEKRAIGAGIIHRGRRFTTHTLLPDEKSALVTFKDRQKVVFLGVFALLLAGLIAQPLSTAIFLVAVLSLIYFLDLLFSLYVLFKNLELPCEIDVSQKELENLRKVELPVYSILCPLYKEANILPQFIKAIEAIDWPKEKLDVLLLLEEDDKETTEAVDGLDLPGYFRRLIVPHSRPKTKPKACNYGLAHANGEFVVIYDAEDKPDPQQLKKAYIAFSKVSPRVVCLQSKLNYYNTHDNLITRLFTAEYSLWFDLVLPGLQSIETTIPLGGTSNHFKVHALRYLDAWDPFNVTEDCDLGTRLFKAGFQTAIIDSTTYEEANARVGGWLRQRSRWIKGYLQTYLVHMRDPIAFVKRQGVHALIFQLVIGMRISFLVINPILWVVTVSYFALNALVGSAIEALYPGPIFYVAAASMVFGNFLYLYTYMIGCAKKGQWDLIKYVFIVPFYWFAASLAAVRAFYQLVSAPYYWEKTQHGLNLERSQKAAVLNPSISPMFARLGSILDFRVNITIEVGKTIDRVSLGKIGKFFYGPIFFIVRVLIEFVDLFGKVDEPKLVEEAGLKILIYNWRDTKHVWAGGAETYIHELSKRWVKNGHSLTLFCGWDGKSRRNEIVDGVKVIRRGGFYSVYPLAIIYHFLKLRGKYDIVIDCENGIPFFTPLFVGTPSILVIHHVHQKVFREYLRFPFSKIAIFLESKLMPFVYKNFPVVTTSQSSKSDIVERGWSDERAIEVVTPGVEWSIFGKYAKKINPSFIYLGRLKPYKNIDVAIEAFAEVQSKFPDSTLTIAGSGESLDNLKKLAKKLGVENSVIFTGRVTDEMRTKLLSENWLAIQPSSIEGWGITVIEANACGTPVIASDVNGLRDSVIDGKTGILTTVNDSHAFAQTMELLIRDERLRKSLSENAYAWSKNFSWDIASKKFEGVLEKAIAERGSARGIPEVAEVI